MKRKVANCFKVDDRGAVAATYALSLFALIAVAGIGFDYARLAGMDSELQNGADQAALAGATQLSREDGSCARATNAAIALLNNQTRFANDGILSEVQINGGTEIDVDSDACTGTPGITFYEDKAKTTIASADADANFIEVTVDARAAEYAFTPIVGALRSGDIAASAMAGLGSAICKVPPIMVCHPDPTLDIDWDAAKGMGIMATGHSPGKSGNKGGNAGSDETTDTTTWSPGNFGFLQVTSGDATNRNAALLQALAYDNPAVECVPIGDNKVDTGTAQGKYDAINTRFGIYDANGGVLSDCESGACSAAPNVIMDLKQNETGNGKKSCRLANSAANGKGFGLPASPYAPKYKTGDSAAVTYDASVTPGRMGMPRDLCHYQTYDENGVITNPNVNDSKTWADGLCPGGYGRFGDKKWGRLDYWSNVHPAGTKVPDGYATMTRYETYLYELANGLARAPTCGVVGPATRRVLTIAVVTNCADLRGTSVPVDIDEFVDVFLVEPSIDATKRYNAFKDGIYMEVIGKSTIAGTGTYASQQVRRDVPYLIE